MKALSTVVASLIILFIVVALVSFSYVWTVIVVEETTSEGTEHIEPFVEKTQASFAIESLTISEVYVRNTGGVKLSGFATYVDETPKSFEMSKEVLEPTDVAEMSLSEELKPGQKIKITTEQGAFVEKVLVVGGVSLPKDVPIGGAQVIGGGSSGGSALGPICGNGAIGDGEECDDGNTNDCDSCTSDCKLNVVELSEGQDITETCKGYVLTEDIDCPGYCFIVRTGNLIIDCDGHSLTGGGAGYGIYVYDGDHVTIENCIINNYQKGVKSLKEYTTVRNSQFNNITGAAIDLMGSDCVVFKNTIRNSGYGIFILSYLSNGVVNENNISDSNVGMYIYMNGGEVKKNIVRDHVYYGIQVYDTTNTIIEENEIYTTNKPSDEYHAGFDICDGSSNIYKDNEVYENSIGFYFQCTENNTIITRNMIHDNYAYGLFAEYPDTKSSLIYDNYFSNNAVNAFDNGLANVWNTTKTLGTNIVGGPYVGGNFWGGFIGTDSDSDGIYDESYTVLGAAGSVDSLPLVE